MHTNLANDGRARISRGKRRIKSIYSHNDRRRRDIPSTVRRSKKRRRLTLAASDDAGDDKGRGVVEITANLHRRVTEMLPLVCMLSNDWTNRGRERRIGTVDAGNRNSDRALGLRRVTAWRGESRRKQWHRRFLRDNPPKRTDLLILTGLGEVGELADMWASTCLGSELTRTLSYRGQMPGCPQSRENSTGQTDLHCINSAL